MKKCSICGEERSRTEFYRHKTGRDGLRGDCKLCTSEKNSRDYQERKKRRADEPGH